jgi:hypothetical protein
MTTGMCRRETGRVACSRNRDASGPTTMTLRLGPLEVVALREAVEIYLFFEMAGGHHDVLEDLHVVLKSWHQGDVR